MDALLTFLGVRRAAPVRVPRPAPPAPAPVDVPIIESSLDRGVRDIRRTDPGFDPSRFAGYVGMIFRTAQHAWMTGDIGSLRDRVTPEMYGEMQAQCDRLRSAGRVNRVAEVEITATVTEAWQERGRDYVTAHISGSIIDYIVDEARDNVVNGSRTIPREVEEFWTFTRAAGLNFWMLSAIQT
jgi:predicted lipid-binding transport protein (Tim44 family)